LLSGHDEGVVCQARLSQILWLLGYPEQAMQRGHEAITLAQELDHPMTLSLALSICTAVYLLLHDVQIAQQVAEASITLAAEQGFTLRLALGRYHRGLALVKQGNQDGIAEMKLGLQGIQGTGSENITSYWLARLAEAYGDAGQCEQGLNLLAEALAMVDKTGNRGWEAEIYRLRGELLLVHDRSKDRAPSAHYAEAEACFHQAIEIARRQQAKSLELRASTSLSRLWQAQGKRAEAHALLAEIYNWFSEGFDTTDLIEAKALLEALSDDT
jgi:predicted ATPase